jgi:hypothetical protein
MRVKEVEVEWLLFILHWHKLSTATGRYSILLSQMNSLHNSNTGSGSPSRLLNSTHIYVTKVTYLYIFTFFVGHTVCWLRPLICHQKNVTSFRLPPLCKSSEILCSVP